MDLEIQTRHLDLDPASRDLVERSAARLSTRYGEMLRLHVALGGSTHHQHGVERVTLVANVRGATLRADKQAEHAREAIHAAFKALEAQLDEHHQALGHPTSRPGPRFAGSVKRIFRDAGYGFLHYQPGRDVHFRRESLHELDFDALEPGMPVRFELEEGREGLQASAVYPDAGAGR